MQPITLPGGLTLRLTTPADADALEQLQILVFPRLSPAERFRAVHYLKHIELFPEGQMVVADGDRIVGMTTTIRLNFDFDHPDHTFEEVIQGGFLTSHDPHGRWLYGADVGTHPDYRRRGIARALYIARHELVRRLGLEGQVTVGMLNGYESVADRYTIDAYYDELRTGRLQDPTISAQLRVGFELGPLVKNYLNDPTCGNAGAVIVWPAAREPRP
jgi:GNAT superfamily N-acetyltransferase